jgi:hypothetical protein
MVVVVGSTATLTFVTSLSTSLDLSLDLSRDLSLDLSLDLYSLLQRSKQEMQLKGVPDDCC